MKTNWISALALAALLPLGGCFVGGGGYDADVVVGGPVVVEPSYVGVGFVPVFHGRGHYGGRYWRGRGGFHGRGGSHHR